MIKAQLSKYIVSIIIEEFNRYWAMWAMGAAGSSV